MLCLVYANPRWSCELKFTPINRLWWKLWLCKNTWQACHWLSVGKISWELNAQSQQIVESALSQNISQGFTWHGRTKHRRIRFNSKSNPPNEFQSDAHCFWSTELASRSQRLIRKMVCGVRAYIRLYGWKLWVCVGAL